jgi:Zn ribbon nucleic-acid-binding protein
MNTEAHVCGNCKRQFTIEPEDFQFYKRIDVPPPTWCPECRLIRRLIWRNERTLYRRKCDAPGHNETLISYYAPEKPYKVYDQAYWWSDAWDPIDYGKEYDFSRPFFEQLKELFLQVPRANLSTYHATMINSDYSNWSGGCKNCYLVTDADYVEDSAYCSSIFKSKDCFDCNNVSESELCYEGYNLGKCYRTIASVNCRDSSDVLFSKGLVGCSNCFGCINLRKKTYHIFNQSYSKEEYYQKIGSLFDGSRESFGRMVAQAEEHWLRYPAKHLRGIRNVNSFGDYIYNCKNVTYGFHVTGAENSKYIALIHSPNVKDCFDYTDWGENAQLVYESITCGFGVSNLKFCCLVVLNSKNASYSYFSYGCSDIFGCANLRKKQYCILNKQYTKQEYESLLPKIIEHMNAMPYVDSKGRTYRYGELFPPELCGFAYNESMAQEFFPLNREEALAKGFAWRDPDERPYQSTLSSDKVPQTIHEVPDRITDEVIACAHKGACKQSCTVAFRIVPPELQFYRRMNLPLPALCPNCRHYERLKHRNPLKLWHRECSCAGSKSKSGVYANTIAHSHGANPCPNEFETSYAPDRPEIVYCEQCYQAEVA